MITLNASPIESVCVDGFCVYVKRDDLLHPDFSGNKARKLFYLLNQDLSGFDHIVSYGSAQSNAMYSLSVLAWMRNKTLDYYVRQVPTFLAQSPAGNYRAALGNGANIIAVGDVLPEGQTLQDYVQTEVLPLSHRALFVPEGGRYLEAQVGVYQLAQEIEQWMQSQALSALRVMLPSGTGTTALFLQQYFAKKAMTVQVLTCACVGGDDYLRRQFAVLSQDIKDYPTIINSGRKFHFGKLYVEFYQLWQSLNTQTGIEFDLLYDPQGWLVLLNFLRQSADQIPLMYIHQGGVLGNQTMRPRYQRKYG